MASKEIQTQVKNKLFAEWMPDKPGGLKGLVNMAADAALAVLGERVEFLEGEIHAYENPGYEEGELPMLGIAVEDIMTGMVCQHTSEGGIRAYLPPEPGDDSDDANQPPPIIPPGPEDGPIDQTQYLCPQCATKHKRDSGIGAKHAHLFYGGQPAISHLEHCPVLKDDEAACNCNAVPADAANRAAERRPGDGFR